ncbi:MAG: pilus assembly protein [Acetatifactor sp.]|nr:pilus assembly protein [Acetatifactor sp.]
MKRTNAYFTVEAALVFPIVLGVVLFTIYLLFFQYDRCLLEQSAGVLAMRGCTLQITDGEELVRELQSQSREEDRGWLAWSMEDAVISLKRNCVTVQRSGELKFPFRGFLSGWGNCVWKCSAARESHRIKPVNFIRNCRKIMGGK